MPTPTTSPGQSTDGRVRRGQRTRSAIVEALLDLLSDGVEAPTAQSIATRAGVSVRSIFQHFSDMEALYEDLVEAQTRRFDPVFRSLKTSGNLDERLLALADQRRELFELISPVRRAIAGKTRRSPAIVDRLDAVNRALRKQVEDQFRFELTGLGASERDSVVESLDMLWSFETWDRLRATQRQDALKTRAHLVQMSTLLLSLATGSQPN